MNLNQTGFRKRPSFCFGVGYNLDMDIEKMGMGVEKEPELPKLKFDYHLELDAWNWVDSIRGTGDAGEGASDWGIETLMKMAPDLVGEIRGAVNEDEAFEIARRGLAVRMQGEYPIQKDAGKIVEKAQEDWQKVESEFWPRLGELLGVTVGDMNQKYTAYFTSAIRCPFYKDNHAFMYSRSGSFVSTAAHEIMHMEFWNKYGKELESAGMDEKQKWVLQESLTVLLNEDMPDILREPDKGYKDHGKLREEMVRLWHKSKGDFERFLPQAIEATKRMMGGV